MLATEKVNNCLICETATFKAINLGMHPYADTFISPADYGKSEPVFPLEVVVCKNCGNAQTSIRTDPKDRYNLYEYSYTSSNSAFSRSYWNEYAKFLDESYKLEGKRVLEVGCNDGYLLSLLKKMGATVYGLDASKEMANICRSADIDVYECVFGAESLPAKITDKKFDIIIANNVLNHSDDPLDFMRNVARLLDVTGVFVAEQPYWLESLVSMRLDQIYHEHVTYVTARSAKRLFESVQLNLKSAINTSYHGGSLRLVGDRSSLCVGNNEICLRIENEINQGIFEQQFYTELNRKYELYRIEFLSKILTARKENELIKIVGFGAAAKGNTFLNYMRLDSTLIDFVIDISPSKVGKYTPLSRIPIIHETELANHEKVLLIPLSWNLPNNVIGDLLEKYKNVELMK